MRPIVVPVSFTNNSADAVRYAADLALAIGSSIHLINLYTVPPIVPEIPTAETLYEEIMKSCHGLLDSLAAAIYNRTQGTVRVTSEVMTDQVDSQLDRYFSTHNPLMVLIGASAGSLQEIYLASHTLRTLDRLRYPLLLIPEHVRFRPVRKIVLTRDGKAFAHGMPLFLKEIGGLLGARLETAEDSTAYPGDHSPGWLAAFSKDPAIADLHRSHPGQILLLYAMDQ